MPFLVLQVFGIMLLSLQNLLSPSLGEKGEALIVWLFWGDTCKRYFPQEKGRKGEGAIHTKVSKMLMVDCWTISGLGVGKLASFASVQMGGEPGWVSLVHKYPGCWCSTEIGARVYERRCSVVFQSNWIFLTLTLFITLTILRSYHPFSIHR